MNQNQLISRVTPFKITSLNNSLRTLYFIYSIIELKKIIKQINFVFFFNKKSKTLVKKQNAQHLFVFLKNLLYDQFKLWDELTNSVEILKKQICIVDQFNKNF